MKQLFVPLLLTLALSSLCHCQVVMPSYKYSYSPGDNMVMKEQSGRSLTYYVPGEVESLPKVSGATEVVYHCAIWTTGDTLLTGITYLLNQDVRQGTPAWKWWYSFFTKSYGSPKVFVDSPVWNTDDETETTLIPSGSVKAGSPAMVTISPKARR
jgi:hypothetical protein